MSIEDKKDNKKIKNIEDLKQLDNTGGILLSQKSNEAIKLIKNKLRKTAETIIEIGELLIEAIDNESTDYKKEFYRQLGMSERSGQRYIQIAKNEVIQKLKSKTPKSLDNMTMTDLLHEMNKNNKPTDDNDEKPKIEPSKRAKDIFKRYKDSPDTLEEIISELKNMLEEHKKESTAIDATIVTSENK
ncbi:MAG: hypothetical protein WC272_11035 [Sulfurimonas sp.]